MVTSKVTTSHEEIQKWAEEHGAYPARVTDDAEYPTICLDFGEPDGTAEPVSWVEFFEEFDQQNFAFLYPDPETAREKRFAMMVERP